MTSTPFNVGLGDGSRSSSRVLRPPGGGHTDIFGGEPEPPRGRRAASSIAANLIQGQGDEPARPTNGDTPNQNGQASEPTPISPEPASPEPASQEPTPPQPSPKTRRPEPTTPESTSPKAITPIEKTEVPKRVRVPPGGFSSGLW